MKGYIDSIYGGMARVLLGPDESTAIDVPVGELPRGAAVGVMLHLRFTLDEAATAARKKKAAPPPSGWYDPFAEERE
jgi:hypothetical protein